MYSTLFILASALFALCCRLATRFPAGSFATILGYWVLLSAGVELVGGVILLFGGSNALLYIVFCALEFVLLVLLAKAARGGTGKWTWVVIGAFLMLWAVNLCSIWGGDSFVTYAFMVGALWLCGLYLQRLWDLVNSWSGNLSASPQFWLCLTVVLYFGAGAPLLGSVNYFYDFDPALAKKIFMGVRALCVLKFILMGITCLHMRNASNPTTDGPRT